MAKPQKIQQSAKKQSQEMTLEESRAYRAARHVPKAPILSEEEKREEFRIFWASHKAMFGGAKGLEKALWLHLKTIKMDSPEQFSEGCKHFGLKAIK